MCVQYTYFCQAEVFQNKPQGSNYLPQYSYKQFQAALHPSWFHYWVSGLNLKGRFFFFLSLGNLEAIVGLQRLCLQVRKNTFCIHKKKYKGVRLNPLKMWPYIFLFYFLEFLMRADFCWCAAHFNSSIGIWQFHLGTH